MPMLVIDAVIILFVVADFKSNPLSNFDVLLNYLTMNKVIVTATPIIALLLNHLLPNKLKEIVTFWKFSNALPGCRAFSEHAPQDLRIDMDSLRKKYGAFPTAPKEQNTLWYRIFKQQESNVAIQESHQRFLCFRDISSISILMLIIIMIISILPVSGFGDFRYVFLLLLAQYLLFMVAARNTANRFVQNVLALESLTVNRSKRTTK